MTHNHLLEHKNDTVEHVRKLNNLENTEKLEQGIDILDAWIQKQEHFVKKQYSRIYIEMQLISSKGSIEKAKKKLDKMCSMRTLLPKFFNISDMRGEFGDMIGNQCVGFPLPKLTENHYRVLPYKQYKNESFEAMSFMDLFKLFLFFYEYLKIHDYCAGYVVILDYSEISVMDVISKLNLMDWKHFASILLDGQGMKIKSINYVSSSKAIENLVKLVKSVISPKLANRIKIHKNYESLYNVVPKTILPAEMGGTERSFKELQEDWLDMLTQKNNEEYLKEMQKAGVDERIRKIDRTDEFGEMAGSFVSLSVD